MRGPAAAGAAAETVLAGAVATALSPANPGSSLRCATGRTSRNALLADAEGELHLTPARLERLELLHPASGDQTAEAHEE